MKITGTFICNICIGIADKCDPTDVGVAQVLIKRQKLFEIDQVQMYSHLCCGQRQTPKSVTCDLKHLLSL